MIIVKLMGGLGNQLFQYAAGRALSLKLNQPLKLDISMYEGPDQGGVTKRVYELHRYNIEAEIATPAETAGLINKKPSILKRAIAKYISKTKLAPHEFHFFKEKSFAFDPEFAKINQSVYLEGHWQSEKFFAAYAARIAAEFTLKETPTGENAKLLAKIKNCDSVALHIRRGDYANNPEVMRTHNLLPLSYYQNAIAILEKSVENPMFYIFSDDPSWAAENLKINHPVICITNNDSDHGYEDLRLMAACQHNIIANSSFSWWGAYLNSNPAKQVYAPAKWFAKEDIDTKDAVPDSWVRVAS